MKKLFLAFFLVTLRLFSNPSGEKITLGEVSFQRNENTLNVNQSSQKAIIHWDDFSINSNEAANFLLPDSSSSILNRVISNNPSKIFGSLNSNGNVYLINQNGIVVSKEGVINTNSFFVTTLNLKDEEFLKGSGLNLSGDSKEAIINYGTIKTPAGNLFLIAQEVINEGSVSSREAYLVGTTEAIIAPDLNEKIFIKKGSRGKVENKGIIESIQTEIKAAGGSAYTFAINQEGNISATGIKKLDGKIVLIAEEGEVKVTGEMRAENENQKGGTVHVLGDYIQIRDGAKIDVSGDLGGGKILIGGDYQGKNPNIKNAKGIYLSEDVLINANANVLGKGGRVILWSDESTSFYGKITAKGGNTIGDGGFVEISSHKHLKFPGEVDLRAENGKVGDLLLDPYNLSISTSATSPDRWVGPPYQYDAAANTDNIQDSDIQTKLATANVTITTGSGGAATDGTITFLTGVNISWSTTNKLTITAAKNIVINSSVLIENTNTDGTNFAALEMIANNGQIITSGNVNGIYSEGNISTYYGNISGIGYGSNGGYSGVRFGGGTIESKGVGLEAATITFSGYTAANPGGFQVSGLRISNCNFNTVDGAITLTGTARGSLSSGTFLLGTLLSGGTVITSTGTDNSVDGTITLNGIGGENYRLNRAIQIEGPTISSENHNIIVNGTNGANSGYSSPGVFFYSGTFNLTGTTSDAATLTFNGQGSTQPAMSDNVGTFCRGIINTIKGNVFINGKGGSTASSNHGIDLDGLTFSSTDTGSIFFDGTAAGTSGVGVYFRVGNISISNTTGDITIDGIGSGLSDVQALTGTLGGETATGDITVNADTVSLSGIIIRGNGDITFAPKSVSTTIGLGNSASGKLNLIASELNTIQNGFSSITFGRADGTGDVNINGNPTSGSYLDPLNVIGGNITVGGAINGGGNTVTLTSNSGILSVGNSITSSGATINLNIGQSGTGGTLNLNGQIIASNLVLTGGSGSDNFNIGVNTITQIPTTALDGGTIGATTNTLTGPNSTNSWSVNNTNAGTLGNITFTNINSLIGGSGSDSFEVSGGSMPSISLGTGTSSNQFTIAAGTVTNLNGNTNASGDDTYTFNGGTITSLSVGDHTNLYNVNDLTVLSTLTGGAGTDTIVGPNATTSWIINGTSDSLTSSGNTLTFSNIDVLTGNSSDDNFTVSGTGSMTTINLRGGTNSFTMTAGSVTEINGNFGSNTYNFSASGLNITTITAGTGNDKFYFDDGASMNGNLDLTNVGIGNELHYEAYNSKVTVDFPTPSNTTGIAGITAMNNLTHIYGSTNSTTDEIIGNSTWIISGENSGSIDGISFDNFENLTGGSGNDSFTFQIGGVITGQINGGSGGVNSITGPNEVSIWTISADNGGNIDPTSGAQTDFINIHSLIGGTSDDTFVFENAATISNINGGTSGVNKLDLNDFKNVVTAIEFDLSTGIASRRDNSNVITNFSNINYFIGTGILGTTLGTPGDTGDKIIGPNSVNVWSLQDIDTNQRDSGTINTTITFEKIANLFGNAQKDRYIINESCIVTGIIHAGSDSDILDYSLFNTYAPKIDLDDERASNIFTETPISSNYELGEFLGIQGFHEIGAGNGAELIGSDLDDIFIVTGGVKSVDGNGGNNTIIASTGTDNIWHITGINAGDINGVTTFTEIQNFTGGNLDDTFMFFDQKVIDGNVDGGSVSPQVNTLDYTFYSNAQVEMPHGPASGIGKYFYNIQNIVGAEISYNYLQSFSDYINTNVMVSFEFNKYTSNNLFNIYITAPCRFEKIEYFEKMGLFTNKNNLFFYEIEEIKE
ncbi:MAG: filamentous hemagglutinin N-terminal domain-containing protein [Parachlamydiales bacterium]|nr:filamentous hemagglutinin N-terminal domain-containing protein [Parachlamydiales bacterium]